MHFVLDRAFGFVRGQPRAIRRAISCEHESAAQRFECLTKVGRRVLRPARNSDPQKIFSCRRKFPAEPRLAMSNTILYWFSLRTVPRESLRYSNPMPQHEPL